jgi:hypothetical protein
MPQIRTGVLRRSLVIIYLDLEVCFRREVRNFDTRGNLFVCCKICMPFESIVISVEVRRGDDVFNVGGLAHHT